MVNIGVLQATLRLKDELSPELEKTQQALKFAGNQATTLGRSFLPLSLAIAGVGIASLKFATDLNAGMANVATLIPGNTERVERLKAAVQGLAVAHGKPTQDLVAGLYQTISAFGDQAGDTIEILRINSMAATAGLATTIDAINLTSAVTKGFGNTTAEAVQKASDLAFITVKLGQTTFPELAGSIGSVVPLAAKLKVSQEELFAVFATLTGVTGNAAEVSTQFAAILSAMLKPTDDMQKAVAQLGFSGAEAMLSQLGMVGSLQALIGTTDGSTEAVAKLFGRAEALTSVFALTGAQAETFAEKLAAMQDEAEKTQQAFDEQSKGINAAGFAWGQFKAKVEVAAQRLGDVLLPIVLRASQAMSPLFDAVMQAVAWFGRLPGPIQTVTVGLVGFVAVIGPILIFFGTLASSIGTLLPLLVAVKAGIVVMGSSALAALAPIAPALAAIAGAAALAFAAGSMLRQIPIVTKAADALADALFGVNKNLGLSDSQARALAQASEIAGREITTWSEATKILAEHNKALQQQSEDLVASAGGIVGVVEELDKGTASLAVSEEARIRVLSDLLDMQREYAIAAQESAFQQEVLNDVLKQFPDEPVPLLTLPPGIGDGRNILDSVVAGVGDIEGATEQAEKRQQEYNDALRQAADLAQVIPGILGDIVSQTVAAAGALSNLSSGGLGKAFSGSGFGKLLGKFGKVAGDLGPLVGIGVQLGTALVKGISSLFSSGPDLIRDAARDMGATISQELADSIEESGRPLQLAVADLFQAGAFDSADRFAQEIGDIFSGLEGGAFGKPEAIQALEESVPLLLANLQELGPAGEEEIQRIIAAADRLGVEFQGLGDLINSTFAPQTLEQMKESLGLTGEEVRALAESLGVDLQTNLERAAAAAGLTVSEFKALQEAAGGALGSDTAASMEELNALMEATGLSAQQLADRLNVDVAGGAEGLDGALSNSNTELTTGGGLATFLANELERARAAANGINFPGGFDPGGGIPAGGFASGTPGLDFMNFGRGSRRTLHGDEAVIPRGRTGELAAQIASELGGRGGGGGGVSFGDIIVQGASDPTTTARAVVVAIRENIGLINSEIAKVKSA